MIKYDPLIKETKECVKCKIVTNLNNFYKSKRSRDNYHSYCKECAKASVKSGRKRRIEDVRNYDRQRYIKERDRRLEYCRKLPKGIHKDNQLRRLYGISLEEYNKLVKQQESKCSICLKVNKLVVDHCHKTGKFRGLLCNKCNTGLGFFQESEESFLNAIKYLKKL